MFRTQGKHRTLTSPYKTRCYSEDVWRPKPVNVSALTLTLTLVDKQTANPCGGGVEYLHRDPASRKRRRKRKSQIWDSKIWSRVPRDCNPRKTTLAKASSIYKRQTHPLVREGEPQKQDRNCQRITNIWSWAPYGARHQDLLIDWLSVAIYVTLTFFVELVESPGGFSSWEYKNENGAWIVKINWVQIRTEEYRGLKTK
jgi:hypothetical protein